MLVRTPCATIGATGPEGPLKYVVWTFLVWVPVVILASIGLASGNCPDGCIGPDGGDLAVILVFFIGLPVYLVGLVVLALWDTSERPPQR